MSLNDTNNMDIGIVLLPNKECKAFVLNMTKEAADKLHGLVELPNNPHITMIHIANQNPQDVLALQKEFEQFYSKVTLKAFNLPIKGIKATGGNSDAGYKWLDLQFDTPDILSNLRSQVVKTFCPLHKGILTRMQDDPSNFIPGSPAKNDIDQCGVTFSNYLPHITTWYVDLPKENKVNTLEEIALKIHADKLSCSAEAVALVELGRNGNAMRIIEQYPLAKESSNFSWTQGISVVLALMLIMYLLSKFMKRLKLK